MIEDLQLGYLVFDTQNLASWERFGSDLLGLQIQRHDDILLARLDSLQQRLIFQSGERDDVAAIGLLAADRDKFERVLGAVRASGVLVEEATVDQARARRVKRLAAFQDPSGLRVELATAPFHAAQPFSSPLVPGGFLTGSQGLGHAVFMVDDLDVAMRFWTGPLGFSLSDTSAHETASGESNAAFLRCNRRHHSIALVQRPVRSTYPRRLLHFMIQAQSMDAVGMAFDRAIDAGLTINRSLGRHPNDRMFSFYATTPSGFDYEFGWGAVEVGDNWAADHYDHISSWGHRPLKV